MRDVVLENLPGKKTATHKLDLSACSVKNAENAVEMKNAVLVLKIILQLKKNLFAIVLT